MKINPYNPFEKFSQNQLLGAGIILTIIGSLLGYGLKGRYDGILDLHFVNQVKIYQPFLDNLLTILVTTILLFLIGKFINPKTRVIDILNAILISRGFIYLSTLFNIGGFVDQKTINLSKTFPNIEMNSDLIWVVSIGFLMILIVAIYLIYLFKGFKVATNCKNPIHVFYFLLGILFSEIILKILFYFIIY